MNLAFACLFLFLACVGFYLASHGIQAVTPWGAFQTVLSNMGGA